MKEKIVGLLKSRPVFYGVLLVSMLIRFFPAGIKYFKYMDDYNQYGTYNLLRADLWNDVFLQYKLFAYRPLAGLLDTFGISHFYNLLWIVLVLMVVLHLLTIYMLDILFERINIPFGRVGALVFAFYPLLTEAAYWISASSRLVVSLFLAVMAVFLLDMFINGEKQGKRLVFGLSLAAGILSQCFYEQTIAFLFVFYYIYLFANRQRIRNKLLYLIPVLNIAAVGAYYFAFRDHGFLMRRMEGASGNVVSTLIGGFKKVWTMLFVEQKYALIETKRWGISHLFAEYLPFALTISFIACICAVFLIFQKRIENGKGRAAHAVIYAVMLFVAPFAPYVLISTAFPYLRNVYISVIGISVVLAVIWERITKFRPVKNIMAAVTAFMMFFCISCQSLQVIGYKTIEKYDQLISKEIAQIIDNEPEYEHMWLFGAKYYYEPLIAPHFQNSVMSDWALTGLLRVKTGKYRQPEFGIYANPVIPGQSYNIEIGENDLLLGLNGLNVERLYLENGKLYLFESGERFGTLLQGESGMFMMD